MAMNGVCNAAHTQGLYNWKEVTDVFMESCSQLELGELLHDDMFGLFEVSKQRVRSRTLMLKR